MSSSNTSQVTSAPARKGPGRRWRDIALLAALFAFVIAGLAGLAAATGWEETKHQLMQLTLGQISILLALSLVNYLFRGARWHLFSNRLGLPTTLIQDLRHFLGGFAMSVTPGRVGELIRMRWLRRETGWAVERTAPLVLMDRASDLAAMGLILAGCIALSAGGIAMALPVAALALIAAFVATRPKLLAGCVTYLYRTIGRFPRLLARVRMAARSLNVFSSGPIMATALTLGLIGWIAEGYAFHILLMWMGADIGLAKAIAIFTFSTLAGGLTGAPGGVGGAEAAMVALLSLEGVPLETSIPATAVIRLTTLWFAILIGLAVFPIAERLSAKAETE
ncbi:lysylphosphatidylglycerol synthase transmembrane domain-containing protein [Octadecabacter sp. 1_MG-2023]|uniref:lysylphosphatidylglycerol synthase transmembrane domain-containing protein n=1 Tax=unclassified Octadecabacter TaxID=196158 RepID=UPI001C08D73F|nr:MULTISPECIES: lysylphosphatidylglycerol synthase transmembrane domain-containing protein [unclassified Octadecabacter]MBU2992010.1 flippase-like domain-containing protein [Octadecabacter sp. B2R22]MDO6735985.1 lysylphosphatidylglycerol synthase transmembrane domain-containing protein [Octadecabacter sp. 1_MG-2023]